MSKVEAIVWSLMAAIVTACATSIVTMEVVNHSWQTEAIGTGHASFVVDWTELKSGQRHWKFSWNKVENKP